MCNLRRDRRAEFRFNYKTNRPGRARHVFRDATRERVTVFSWSLPRAMCGTRRRKLLTEFHRARERRIVCCVAGTSRTRETFGRVYNTCTTSKTIRLVSGPNSIGDARTFWLGTKTSGTLFYRESFPLKCSSPRNPETNDVYAPTNLPYANTAAVITVE